YDDDGNQTTIAYPGGVYQCTLYDASSRITEVSGFVDSSAPTCTAAGESGWPSTRITDFSYSYQDATSGMDTDLRQSEATRGGTTHYCYDDLGRLQSADTSSSSCPDSTAPDRYVYDGDGNMTSMTENSTTSSFGLDAGDQITTSGFGYDGNGSQTADPG